MRGGLALTRRAGENIILDFDDGPICISIVRVEGGKVQIVIKAPDSVRIMRGELDRGGGRRFDEEFRCE